MQVSVIISVYKDTQALEVIINSLLTQTYAPNEIIISEDGNSEEMKHFFSSQNNDNIIHLSQEDNGWQKNKALNRAIKRSKNDYLIFIDGDCVPYLNFIESHIKLSQKNAVLCGRRTEPGKKFSKLLRNKKLSILQFQSNYFFNYFKLKKDKIRHYDDGIAFNENSLIFKTINKYRMNNNHIVGCNFSCYKNDLEKINGFDEDFLMPTTGEDTDIERRMKYFGVSMNSCRNCANVIHLYHKKNFNPEITKKTEALMQRKKDIFICKNGINSL